MWDWRQLRWLNYLGWWPTYCKTKRGYKFARFCGLFLYFFDAMQMIPEIIAIIQGISNSSTAMVVFNTNQVLMGVQCSIKIGLILKYESTITSIMHKFEEMEERMRDVIDIKEMKKQSAYREFRCYMSTYFVPAGMLGLCLWCSRPLMMLAQGIKVNMIDAWVPIDTHATMTRWLTFYFIQLVHTVTAVIGITIADSFMFSVLEMLHLQMDYLKLAKEINKALKYTILSQAIIATVVICISVFEFSKIAGTGFLRKTAMFILAVCQAYDLLVYSWLAKEIEEEDTKIIRAAYESNWYEANEMDKKSLCILMDVAKTPICFGTIIYSNLGTFITVLKSAFSYYQFLETVM